MTDWHKQARDRAATLPIRGMTAEAEQAFRHGIVYGAQMQREWLTDGATALRIANHLHVEDYGDTIDQHEAHCEEPSCDRRAAYVGPALDLLAHAVGNG